MANIDMSNRPHGVAVYPHVTNLITTPADDTAVTAALRAVMALDGMQQVEFAARLSAIDARFADGLGVMVLEAVGLTMPPPPRRRGPSAEFRQRIAELAREVGTVQP